MILISGGFVITERLYIDIKQDLKKKWTPSFDRASVGLTSKLRSTSTTIHIIAAAVAPLSVSGLGSFFGKSRKAEDRKVAVYKRVTCG